MTLHAFLQDWHPARGLRHSRYYNPRGRTAILIAKICPPGAAAQIGDRSDDARPYDTQTAPAGSAGPDGSPGNFPGGGLGGGARLWPLATSVVRQRSRARAMLGTLGAAVSAPRRQWFCGSVCG